MTSREKILECAERIVLRDGVTRLTLDAVAAEAGMSKGGLLYHFRSKDDLVRGMIDRLIDLFEAEMQKLMTADPDSVGRAARAYLRLSFPEPASSFEHHKQVSAALLAAIFNNAALLEPLRQRFQIVQERLMNDGLDPVRVNFIRIAADGLWMADVLGIPGPDENSRAAVVQKLYEMTK